VPGVAPATQIPAGSWHRLGANTGTRDRSDTDSLGLVWQPESRVPLWREAEWALKMRLTPLPWGTEPHILENCCPLLLHKFMSDLKEYLTALKAKFADDMKCIKH